MVFHNSYCIPAILTSLLFLGFTYTCHIVFPTLHNFYSIFKLLFLIIIIIIMVINNIFKISIIVFITTQVVLLLLFLIFIL